uniref:Uncharacterized protein n=1 Tax=Anopheles atroparvus TaxID=41427 RepID=A0A182JHS9_ANOAO
MLIFPSHNQALSIFPIGNGNGQIGNASISDDEDSDDDIEFVLPKDEEDVLETLVRSGLAAPVTRETANDEPQSLLDRLDRKELTITERRCQYDVKGNSSVASNQIVPLGNGNGHGSGVLSPPSRGTDSCSEPEDMERLHPGSTATPVNGSDLVDRPNGIPSSLGSQKPLVRKRRTRKTISPDDPAEALTEMSVRGLNLFRYATVNDGLYECVECSKDGGQKTFKNKYSFQRHAFLYHEGQQRKVFPCPVCSKEFSRPDKMKNHWRMTHGVAAAATAALQFKLV